MGNSPVNPASSAVAPGALDSFEAEAASHIDGLYALAWRLTKNTSEAEDLVQDAFVKALRAKDQFQPGTNLKAWLCRILTNAFINRYRRGGLERTVLDGPDADPLADGWISSSSMRNLRDPETSALLPIVEGEIRAAVDALPPEFRLAIILCDLEEFSYEEIAKIMGCPIGTVMSRLHRGRKILQKSLYAHAVEMGIIEQAPAGTQAPAEPTSLADYRAKAQKRTA